MVWSLYDMDVDGEDDIEDCDDIVTDRDVLVAWDIEREEEAGAIPEESYEKLVAKLKTIMKGKKKARN